VAELESVFPFSIASKGPIAEARASHERAAAETAALELQVRREVVSTKARYDAASSKRPRASSPGPEHAS
jgi:hypothetical protein